MEPTLNKNIENRNLLKDEDEILFFDALDTFEKIKAKAEGRLLPNTAASATGSDSNSQASKEPLSEEKPVGSVHQLSPVNLDRSEGTLLEPAEICGTDKARSENAIALLAMVLKSLQEQANPIDGTPDAKVINQQMVKEDEYNFQVENHNVIQVVDNCAPDDLDGCENIEGFQVLEVPTMPEVKHYPDLEVHESQLLNVAIQATEAGKLTLVLGNVVAVGGVSIASTIFAISSFTNPIGIAIGIGALAVSSLASYYVVRNRNVASGKHLIQNLKPEQRRNLARKLRRAISQAGMKTASQVAQVLTSPKAIIKVIFRVVLHFFTDDLQMEIDQYQMIE